MIYISFFLDVGFVLIAIKEMTFATTFALSKPKANAKFLWYTIAHLEGY